MSTYKRDRNSKTETNFTSSFIAGGTQYTHHPDSLAGAFRFEEPYVVSLSVANSLTINDSSGAGRHAAITSGSLDPISGVPEDQWCLPVRTAESTPHLFKRNRLSGSNITDREKLLAPNSISGNQVRVLHFATGSSERIELPASFTDKLNAIDKDPVTFEQLLYSKGVTYAFWIKLDGDDALFSYTAPSGYEVTNPYRFRNIFVADRENYFADLGLDGDEIDFGRAFSIRILNDAKSSDHRKISIVATHKRSGSFIPPFILGPVTQQTEWIVDKAIPDQVWTHVGIVFPHTYKPLTIGDPPEPFDLVPKAYIDGAICTIKQMPVDVKNKLEITVSAIDAIQGLGNPTDLSGSYYPNNYINVYIETPFSASTKTSLLRLNTAAASADPIPVFPSATIAINSGWDDLDNHLSTFSIKDTQGNSANFVVDFFHTGSIAKFLNGNIEVESPQMVNPDPANLPVVEINYNPFNSSYADIANPDNFTYVRLTTANNATRIYMFDDSIADLTSKIEISAAENIRCATAQPLPVNTYNNGTLGVGSYIEGIVSASINNGSGIDGIVDLAINDLVLVKNEPDEHKNGVYKVTEVGIDSLTPWKLTRSTDADESAELIRGRCFEIDEGSINVGKIFIHFTPGTITLGTTEIKFVESLPGPESFAYTILRPNTFVSGAPVSFKIYDRKSDYFIQFENDESSEDPTRDSSTLYKIGVKNVTGSLAYAERIFLALKEAAIEHTDLELTIGRLNNDNQTGALISETLEDVQESGTIPLYLQYPGEPRFPKTDGDIRARSIAFIDGSSFFDTVFSGSFSMGHNAFKQDLFYNTGSVSLDFETGSNVYLANIAEQQNVYNYSNFPFFDYRRNLINASCRDGVLIETLPINQPVFIFGDGSTLEDSKFTNEISNTVEGSNFASNRYIKLNRAVTGDAIVRFSARPAKSASNLVNSISRKLLNDPIGTDKGIHVQVSGDGITWYSCDAKVFEQRRNKQIFYTSKEVLDGASPLNRAVRSTKLLSDGFSKITYDDFDVGSEWQHFVFYCDHRLITDSAVGAFSSQSYFIRIIQEGYSASYSDNWAITNVSIEGKFSHHIRPQVDEFVNLVPIEENPSETWDNFVSIINGDLGHDGEIVATHDSAASIVRLSFQSPVGIISDGISGGQLLTSSLKFPSTSLTTNCGFAQSLTKTSRIKLVNFDGGGTSKAHNSYLRVGVKDATIASDVTLKIFNIVNASSSSYTESKILSSIYQVDSIDVYSHFMSGTSYAQESPKRTDGSLTTGWMIEDFTDFRFSKSVGFFGITEDADYYKKVAARIAGVINDNSSSMGIRAYATSSLTADITLEHIDNNSFGPYCKISVFEYMASPPARTSTQITYASDTFSGGTFSFRDIPLGCVLESFGKSYIGTSPRDLEFYESYGINGFLDIASTLQLNTEFASKIGGRTPKCMIDDFVVWSRCLSPEEINAIYSSRRGAFDLKSGLSSFDPRLQIRDEDNEPNIYPTNARSTDEDFKGNFKIQYSSDQEIVPKKVYATAELIFYRNPLPKSFFTITDWKSNTKSFQFISSNRDKSSGKIYISIETTLAKTLKALVKSINSFGSGTGSGFGITAQLTKDNKVILTQTGVGTDTGFTTGNTSIVKSKQLNNTDIAFIPSSFTGGTFRSSVEYPFRVPESHPLLSRLIAQGHARGNLLVNAPAIMTQEVVAHTDSNYESITPYKEDAQFGAFGTSLHLDTDPDYNNKNKTGAKGDFWFKKNDIPGIKKSGPTWAKHKIEIDLQPKQKTKLFKHTTTGSTTAYFNFESKIWEPIGTISTGSYRTIPAGTNAYASCRLIVNQYHFDNNAFSSFVGEILTNKLLFILEDSFGRSVSFIGINSSEAGVGQYFKRYSNTLYGILTSNSPDLQLSFFKALDAAFLLGDICIKPELSDTFVPDLSLVNFAIDLVQIDLGIEGNTNIVFPGESYNNVGYHVLSGSLGFFPAGQANFTYGAQIKEFQGGDREEKETASFFGRQNTFVLTGAEDPRDTNFRKWLDTTMIGFSPSIGIRALNVDNTNSNVEILSGTLSGESKYVLLDGGLSSPVTTFGFPFHPKFHATGSQTLNLKHLIDRPFLVEKIAYQFRANLYESASIQTFVGGDTETSSSYGSDSNYLQSAFINIPTPTFFLLNQRKCSLPYSIVNDLNVIALADEEGPIVNTFQYTASIPSNFYLTSMTNGSGPATFVDDTRDLVTFARFASVPHAFTNNDFEPFVPDIRNNLDLVLIPNQSDESQNDKIFVQEAHPESSFTITAPVRAPKKSQSISSFRTEGDFFGSRQTTYEFSVNESLLAAPIKGWSDSLILEDAAGTLRRFVFTNGSAASVVINGLTDFPSYGGITGQTVELTDSNSETVTFEFRTEVLVNNPVRVDSHNYYIGVQGVSATSGPTYAAEICESFALTVNLAFSNGDLDIFTEYTAGTSITLLQGTTGEDGNTYITTSLTWSPAKTFAGGEGSPAGGPIYLPFGGAGIFDPAYSEGCWLIPVNKNIAAPGGAAFYASKFYQAIAIAGRESSEFGGFAVPFVLQSTGTSPITSFTFKQGIGGQRGFKNIAGTGNFEDKSIENLITPSGNFARYASLTIVDDGVIQNDLIQLDWSGNRTGIPAINSGRSPLGGENGSVESVYRSSDGSGLFTIEHGISDSSESPYLLTPEDNLIFGWQSPIATGSHLYHSTPEIHGSFEILPGAGKIVLYGSILQNNEEKTHVTSNQPLTSEAAHEDIFSNADVCDIFDTEPYIFHFGNTLDQFVDGVVEMNTSPPQLTRRVISKATDGNHAVGPRNGSYPIFSKRSSFFRGYRLVDANETIFDTMTPSINALMIRDEIKTYNPGFDDGGSNAKTGVIILSHPSVTSSGDEYDSSSVIWNKWMASFPFESRYEGITRTLGFNTSIARETMSGSTSLGVRPSTHVWLANSSNTLRGYRDETQTDFQEMLFNIEKSSLFEDSSTNLVGTRPQPFNINYSIVTDESGEGPPGDSLTELDFESKFLGTKIGPRSKYFFGRLFFGAGEGTYKFPKLPYWKNVYVTPGQGFDLNETFPVTRGVVIRGYKYGLQNITPTKTSAVYRRDHYGYFRDQLEQRLFTKTYRTNDATSDDTPVTVQFRSRNLGGLIDPAETNSANLSLFCTSSIPYDDGNYRDRYNLSPDDRALSVVNYTVT